MATYTDNYQLTKPLYSETADVAAINNNMDKIDDIMHASQVSLAPAYDQNETYNTGDVVMYEFLMYECLEDNVTGVWDATKWQRTTAGEHGGGSSASEVSYDNTDSGMTATNVQDAIDELKGEIEDIPSVEANPQGAATEELTKIGIGGTIYEIDSEEITGEASGAIASFADGSANPLKSLVVDINPVQAGSGTPAPDNVRPISGWSNVEVTVADDTTEETYEISLGQTVYGGKLNVTTGELTVDRYLYSFTGNESFISNPSAWGNYAFLYNTGVNIKSSFSTPTDCKSSHLETVNAGGWNYLTPNTFMIAGTTFMGIGFDGTEAELKAWLTSQNTANTPVQIMGVLETPTTIELTPTEVDSLLGNNNIWANTGDSKVVYIRDIDKAFNILWNAVMNSNSGTRSLNLMKGAISETKEDIEEPIQEEPTEKEGNDEIQR